MDEGDATSDDLLLPVEESEDEREGGSSTSASEEEGASRTTVAPSRWKKAVSWRFWLSEPLCTSLIWAHGDQTAATHKVTRGNLEQNFFLASYSETDTVRNTLRGCI